MNYIQTKHNYNILKKEEDIFAAGLLVYFIVVRGHLVLHSAEVYFFS